jgi:hypothetical protein
MAEYVMAASQGKLKQTQAPPFGIAQVPRDKVVAYLHKSLELTKKQMLSTADTV